MRKKFKSEVPKEKVLQSLLSNILYCMHENKYLTNNKSKKARHELVGMIEDAQELSEKLISIQEVRNTLRLIFKP